VEVLGQAEIDRFHNVRSPWGRWAAINHQTAAVAADGRIPCGPAPKGDLAQIQSGKAFALPAPPFRAG
jgi:hypothetical protein